MLRLIREDACHGKPIVPVATVFNLYGGYDLRRGDSDPSFRYGGSIRQPGGPDPLPGPGQVPFVLQLQRDLQELGFSLVGTPDGELGRHTEWAVREFQIHARMPKVAHELPMSSERYLDRLEAVANDSPYSGPVSGVVNLQTRAALSLWLTRRWRCPVVLEAWRMNRGQRVTREEQNFWLPSEVRDKTLQVFARDFSGYFEGIGASQPFDSEHLIAVGKYQPFLSFEGPVSLPPRHTWPSAEITPETLMGAPLSDVLQRPESLSTFKAVRAVSEIECLGFFDCINGYDNAFLSLGPCHWILGDGRASGTVGAGELGAFLAYYRDRHPTEAAVFLDRFGLAPAANWPEENNGAALFSTAQRKYTAWISVQDESGAFRPLPQRVEEAEAFRTWHWFYRFAMAARALPNFRRRMWDMARIRLRDVLQTPWGPGIANVPDGTGTRPARIGDLYSSEAAAALILRWHIRAPAHVVNGRAATRLREAFAKAEVPANAGPPSQWNRAIQDRLVQALVDEVKALGSKELRDQFDYLLRWPTVWGSNPRQYQLSPVLGPLSRDPRSFRLDLSGLPPRPF